MDGSCFNNICLCRTWLEKLAELHLASKNMAEVAMAKLHIAALMAEYLNRRGELPLPLECPYK